ncbi:MAG: hypothetical protein ACI8W1_001715 [Candidatus Azotimanducaceae bacterium]|jgi:hypothetical protein
MGSETNVHERFKNLIRFFHISMLFAATLLIGGCTTSVIVEGTIPTPLVATIPANIAVYYSDDFKSFQHEETIRQHGNFKVDMGGQNLLFFRNLMTSVFENVTEIDDSPLIGEKIAGFDGILIPEIIKYGFLTPNVSGLKFYSASIHYRMSLYDLNNEKLGEWTIVGYGKSERTLFGATDSLSEATMLAIRDGGARIAIEMESQPVVQTWLRGIGN